MRYVELRRHTDNDGDRLTSQGVGDAEMIGRDRLHPPYAAFVSAGAARATQMLEILRHAAGQDDTPITAATGLRSSVENRWREAAKAAGKGADLEDIRAIDPDLVERESWLLGSALRQVVAGLPEGGRALVVGHSPTTEAAPAAELPGKWPPPPRLCWVVATDRLQRPRAHSAAAPVAADTTRQSWGPVVPPSNWLAPSHGGRAGGERQPRGRGIGDLHGPSARSGARGKPSADQPGQRVHAPKSPQATAAGNRASQ